MGFFMDIEWNIAAPTPTFYFPITLYLFKILEYDFNIYSYLFSANFNKII
jgi:hypothetical protein